MVHSKDPQQNETDKVGDDECRVDHAIGGCIHMFCLISLTHGRCKRYEDSPRTKSRCCLALGMPGSSVFSAAATEPVGYSPPNSIHSSKNLRYLWNNALTYLYQCRPKIDRHCTPNECGISTIASKGRLTYTRALIVPWAPPTPLEAACKAENTNTIQVQRSIPN